MPPGRPAVAPPGLRIRYDADLLEAAVEAVLRHGGDRTAGERYRRAADRIYTRYPDPESRRQAFDALHARLFEEMGCAPPVRAAASGLEGQVSEVLVGRAWTQEEEGADLDVRLRAVRLRLLPARFLSLPDLEVFLHHEFVHILDMLDDGFGYGPGAEGLPGTISWLLGERFGCLWDCSVDGRIARAGGRPLHPPGELEERCARLFPALPPGGAVAVVRRLWEGERPSYPTLLRWAVEPAALAAWAGCGPLQSAAGPPPGAPCPLCGFPTHEWAGEVEEGVLELIRADFPTWQPREGACARCVEVYVLRLTGPRRRIADRGAGSVGRTGRRAVEVNR